MMKKEDPEFDNEYLNFEMISFLGNLFKSL